MARNYSRIPVNSLIKILRIAKISDSQNMNIYPRDNSKAEVLTVEIYCHCRTPFTENNGVTIKVNY